MADKTEEQLVELDKRLDSHNAADVRRAELELLAAGERSIRFSHP